MAPHQVIAVRLEQRQLGHCGAALGGFPFRGVGKAGCVEQAQASVRRRSFGNVSHFDSVSPAPKAACADTPRTYASLTHPMREMRTNVPDMLKEPTDAELRNVAIQVNVLLDELHILEFE